MRTAIPQARAGDFPPPGSREIWTMSLNNLSVSRKLALGFALVVLTELVMCAVVLTSLGAIRKATDANNVSTATLAAADAALSALVEQQNAVRAYVATGDASFPPRIAAFQSDFAKAVDRLDAIAVGADEEAGQMRLRADPASLVQAQASLLTKGRLTHSREILKSITDPEHV